MLDLHNHIIYGLDDGAQNFEDSIAMIDMAYKNGTRIFVATPHFNQEYRYETKVMEHNFQKIVEYYKIDKPDMQFYMGNEAFLNEKLKDALLEERCKTMANTSYVLTEVSPNAPYHISKLMLSELMLAGYMPIIAHCERLIAKKDELYKIAELKDMGCLLQINTGIILESAKGWIKKWVMQNLKDGTISFVASDGHSIDRRKPILDEAYKKVLKKLGKQVADDVFYNNGLKMIQTNKDNM